jgi:hypothetical protein
MIGEKLDDLSRLSRKNRIEKLSQKAKYLKRDVTQVYLKRG